MFKEGDKVISNTFGESTVSYVEDEIVYVSFDEWGAEEFTVDGRYNSKLPVSLFHAEGYKPPVPGKEPVRCEFEKGEMVLGRDDDDQLWEVLFFSSLGKPPYSYFMLDDNRDIEHALGFRQCIKFDIDKVGTI